jgi:Ca-activated chloride channel family protein
MATRRRFLSDLLGAGASLAAAGWPRAAGAQGVRPRATTRLPPRPIISNDIFRIDAELVPTTVTVRDGDGRLVTSLTQEDFNVAEAGTAQQITQFARDRVPISLALVLDVSDSMRGPRMDDARNALLTFAEDLLKPEDEAALLVFNHETRVLLGWTSDRARLREALEGVRPTGGTAIYDAVNSALPLFEDRRHPRAAMVLISDGADTASDISVIDLKQKLGRGDVFLYGIAVDTPNARSAVRINPQVFRELSAQSGGYAEIISSTADIGPATTRIADELNAQYMIGYTPSTPGDGKYRSIRVSVQKGLGYAVRSRRGVVR